MKTKRLSQQQIAKEAGVSQKTVSNVLRGHISGKVSPETCRRIREIVESYDYDVKLNSNAVSCRKKSTAKRIILLRATTSPDQLKEIEIRTLLHSQQFMKVAREAAEKNGMELIVQSLSKENSAVKLDWEDLEYIKKGDRILVETYWNMHGAVALQKRGCHVAMLADESFWLHYYSPMFSKFAMFIRETEKTNRKLFSFLVSSGAERIAVLAFRPYYFEPEHALRTGYERCMGLHGLSYRNTILMDHKADNYCEVISKAYKKSPFDALVLNFTQLPSPALDPSKTLHENLGLPEDVILFFTDRPFFPIHEPGKSYYLSSILEQTIDDAIQTLANPKFKKGIRYYERNIEPLTADVSGNALCEIFLRSEHRQSVETIKHTTKKQRRNEI